MNENCGSRRPGGWMARLASRALRLRSEEGGSLVELAMFAPLLFIVLTGAASFTFAFFNLQQLGNATASAVQVVAAQQGVNSDPCNLAMTTIQGELPGFTAANLSYTLTVTGTTGSATVFSSTSGSNGSNTTFSCGGTDTTSTNFAADEPVTLQVSYTYSWLYVLKFTPAKSPLTATETAMAD
jgi:Flp pilus assembly protein TadG